MKKLFIVVAILCLCGMAYAEQTGVTAWHSHSYVDSKDAGWQDKYSEYQEKQGMGLGLGLDTVVYEAEGDLKDVWCLDSLNVESKWDINNGNASVYGVAHVNAWRAIKNILK